MENLLVFCLLVAAAAALPHSPLSGADWEKSESLNTDIIDAYNRIVGGVISKEKSRPYQAGVFAYYPDGRRGFCGGVLISDLHVLTVAHCWRNVNTFIEYVEVHLGSNNIYSVEPTKSTFNSTNVVIHPGWSTGPERDFQHDIAVITAPQRIELTPEIQPIALPPRSVAGNSFFGSTAIASGWGYEHDSSTAISPVLREVELTIISNSLCWPYYWSTLKRTHICSSPRKNGICRGDNGGPLATQHNGEQILIGVAAYITGWGCDALYPSVFTRITDYLDWISDTTKIAIRA